MSSFIVIIAAFSIFIWALAKQGNGGPLFSNPEAVYGAGRLQGSQLGWVMMRCITSGVGAWSGGVRLRSLQSQVILSHVMIGIDIVPKRYVGRLPMPYYALTHRRRLFALCQEDRRPIIWSDFYYSGLPTWLEHPWDRNDVLRSGVLSRRASAMVRPFHRPKRVPYLILCAGSFTICSLPYKDMEARRLAQQCSSLRSRSSCRRCL